MDRTDPDDVIFSACPDPAEAAVSRESSQLASIAAVQGLPSRQRAVLLLRDVVGLHTDEVSELMAATVASVTSALQRARSTLAARHSAGADSASSGQLSDTAGTALAVCRCI